MFGLPAWLLVFPVMGFLVFIHELGHFLTAKWFGITVKEFGFGFPPRLIGIRFTQGGTIYSLNWIPLGGFVRMVGEHGDPADENEGYAPQRPDKNVILLRLRKRKKTYYDVLAVRPTATQEDIQFAYAELVEALKTRDPDRRDYVMGELDEIYNDLSTPSKRREYDKLIGNTSSSELLDPMDYYDFFGVSPSATQPEIDASYSRIRHKIMTDGRKNRDGWSDYLDFIYAMLSDPEKRALYDKRLSNARPQEVRFTDRSVLKRTIVLCAGSFMNLLFPVVVFAVLFALPHAAPTGTIAVMAVAPGSPAQQAGLTPGDMIVALNGESLDTHGDLIQGVASNLGSEIALTVRRGAFITGHTSPQPTSPVEETLTLVPRLNPPELTVVDTVSDPGHEVALADARRYNSDLQIGDTMQQGAMGVRISTIDLQLERRSYPVYEAVPMAFSQIGDVLSLSYHGLRGWASGGQDPGFAGPVGIARVTGEVAQVGVSPLLQLMAIISISLGIINILPIPALDGGRLVFVILEWLRGGKPISPRREGVVHLVGFLVLIGLIILITYRDVVNLISGGSVFP